MKLHTHAHRKRENEPPSLETHALYFYIYFADLHEDSDTPGIEEDDKFVDSTPFAAPHEDELPCLVRKETVSHMELEMMLTPFESLSSAKVNMFSWEKEQKTTYDPLDDWGLSSKFLKDTIYDTLLMYSDIGDFQICALVVLVLGDEADFPSDRMSRWFYSYIRKKTIKQPTSILLHMFTWHNNNRTAAKDETSSEDCGGDEGVQRDLVFAVHRLREALLGVLHRKGDRAGPGEDVPQHLLDLPYGCQGPVHVVPGVWARRASGAHDCVV